MKTIFCAVHGYTQWEAPLLQIINTPEFQRMKRIKQLAAVHHVFPCAAHTRFEHSIGVGFLAECFAKSLMDRQPALQINILALKLAGLCHDIGHGPLSHAYDRFLAARDNELELTRHEERSTMLLRQIVSTYGIDLGPRAVDIACELIDPVRHDLPLYMYQIIANDVDGIDVDKLDYLCRDSQNTGMRYRVDIHRFFQYSRVLHDRLCYSGKSMPYEINNLFTVRHQMHAQVYQHPVVRAFEHMYIDVMHLLGSSICLDGVVHKLIGLTDFIFTSEFCELCVHRGQLGAEDATKVQALLMRISCRDIYKAIHQVSIPTRACIREERLSHYILDVVDIGYAKNPLFDVHFYDENGRGRLESHRFHSFAMHPRDTILRIYDKSARTESAD